VSRGHGTDSGRRGRRDRFGWRDCRGLRERAESPGAARAFGCCGNQSSPATSLRFLSETNYNSGDMQRMRVGDVELGVFSIPVEPSRWPADLGPGERDVARGLLRGRSHREIAAGRGVAEATVDQQVSRVFAKLGVASGAELTRLLARGDAGAWAFGDRAPRADGDRAPRAEPSRERPPQEVEE
jgi:DNA-binding CsgD family transcriptional regulator